MVHEKTVHRRLFEKLQVHSKERTYPKKQGGVILHESEKCLLLLYTSFVAIENRTLVWKNRLLLNELVFPP